MRARADGATVVLATGSRPAPWEAPTDGTVRVVDAAVALGAGADALPPGPVVVLDPVGGPVAVGVAEWLAGLGRDVALVTPDQIAGTLLSRTGDLADANTRLQRAGVRRELRAVVRRLEGGRVHVDDVWTGEPGAPSTPPRWSTAATACPRSPSTWPGRAPCGPATASPRAPCSRRCSKAGGGRSRSAARCPPTAPRPPRERPHDRSRARTGHRPCPGAGGRQGGPRDRRGAGPGTQPRRPAGRRRRRPHRRRRLRAGGRTSATPPARPRTWRPRPDWSRRPVAGS